MNPLKTSIRLLLITLLSLTGCEILDDSPAPVTAITPTGGIPPYITSLRVIPAVSAPKSFWGPNYYELLQPARLEFEGIAARKHFTIALSQEDTSQLSHEQLIAQEQARARGQSTPEMGANTAADALVFLSVVIVREMREGPPTVWMSRSGYIRERRSGRQGYIDVTVAASAWDIRINQEIWRAKKTVSDLDTVGANDMVRYAVREVALGLPSRADRGEVRRAVRALPSD